MKHGRATEETHRGGRGVERVLMQGSDLLAEAVGRAEILEAEGLVGAEA